MEMLGYGRSLENHIITQIRDCDYTDKKYCMNGARTSRIHQDGAAPGRRRPTLATGGQAFVSRRTRISKSYTTEYNKTNTQLKIMQWNAEGVIRKKTELEHILKKESIDICCIEETHLQKKRDLE